MYSICTVCVEYITVYVKYMHSICRVYVQSMYNICTVYVKYMYSICTVYVKIYVQYM